MKIINEDSRQDLGVKPRDVHVGDLLWVQTVGKCTAVKWFAPALLGVVIVDPDSDSTGEWRYIRGYDFGNTVLLSKGDKDENNRL